MASKIELRKINKDMIYRCIYHGNGISRQEIANQTGLSFPTVLQNLADLEARNLITSDGVFESTGGRKAKVIRCSYDAAYAVGIDLTQNHVTTAIVDLEGKIICGGKREAFPYEDTDAYYDGVVNKLTQLLNKNKINRSKIQGAGISLPCIVDREKNLVTYGRNLQAPVDIRHRFSERLPFAAEIFNDANSAGFAETWKDTSDKMRFYLMLSNSVGGSIIRDKEIYLGDHCRSAEIGHTKIVPGGDACYCGQHGCVNAYCSARLLSDRAEGKLEYFFERMEQGDKTLQKAFDTYLDHLAITVLNLRMLFDCDIILGGYIGSYMDQYMDRLGKRLSVLNPYEAGTDYVRPCHYKIEASAVGAALPFIQKFIEAI